jgi:hypothetical protein
LIGAVLRLFGENAARAAYLIIERKPFVVVGDASKEAVNGLYVFCPNRVLRELESDGTVSSSLSLLKNFVDAERSDPSANRFLLTGYNMSADGISRLHSIVPLGWVAVSPELLADTSLPTDLPAFDVSSSSFRGFPPVYEIDYEFSLISKARSLLDEGDEATADEYTRLEQKEFSDKAKAFRTLVTEGSEDPPERFVESLLNSLERFNVTPLQVSKMISLLRCERYDNILNILESKLGPSHREKLMTELWDRTRKPMPLDPISILSLRAELVPVAKAIVKLGTATVDEVAKEIRKRKGVTFKLLDEMRERGYLTLKKIEGKVSFSTRA